MQKIEQYKMTKVELATHFGIWLLCIGAVVLLVTLTGCGSFRTLEDRAEEAFNTAINPRCREINYLRNIDQVHYHREECAGDGCKEMESCQ